MIAEDFLHGKLNGFIGRDEHRSVPACPGMRLVVEPLQFDQDFLARDQLALSYKPIESLPQRREDFPRVRTSPSVHDGTRVKAVGQEAAPVLMD